MIKSKIFEFEGKDLEYSFRESKTDRKHLVIIFSGGFVGNYDFYGKSMDQCWSSILWIKDSKNTYYIREKSDNWMERATQALIHEMLQLLGLERSHCTLLGASKGGTGALFHGIKYNFKNIVVSAPRIHPGAGNILDRPSIVHGLTPNGTASEIIELDSIIPNLLDGDKSRSKNIYLFSSPLDEQYTTDIQPNINKFNRYSNFNYIETLSPNVTRHDDVTRYNLPLITSILNLLVEGIEIKFGNRQIGYSTFSSSVAPAQLDGTYADKRPIIKIHDVDIKNGNLFISGKAFFRGKDASKYSSVIRHLILKNASTTEWFSLGSIRDRDNNRDYFDLEDLDYSCGSFSTIDSKGISLDALPNGKYNLLLSVKQDNFFQPLIILETDHQVHGMSGNLQYINFQAKTVSICLKRDPLD